MDVSIPAIDPQSVLVVAVLVIGIVLVSFVAFRRRRGDR
jgi:preprotein translocase subunit Sec61beta